MKKTYIYIGIGIVLLGLVVWWRVAGAAIVVVDSYSESHFAGYGYDSNSIQNQIITQTFTVGNNITLDHAVFYIERFQNPTGNITASLYSQTGTAGSGAHANTLLATSDSVNITTISTSYNLVSFNFSGANRYSLLASTGHYLIAINFSGGDISNSLITGTDNSFTSAHGNLAFTNDNGSTWNYNGLNGSQENMIFYVYGDNGGGTPVIVSGSGQKMLMSMTY